MEWQQLTEQFLFCCIQNKNLETNSPLMAFLESQGRRTAFLLEKQLEMGYKVMSKINLLINLMFYRQNNTVLASNNSKFIGCQS
jgi:hypothetical protein